MAMTEYTGDVDIIAGLDDQPNDVGGLTAAQLKAKFDEAFKTFIEDFFNTTHKTEFDAKSAVGSGTPSTQNYGDAAAGGSSSEAARIDHKHAMPATTKDKTAMTGILKGDGTDVSAATAGTDYQAGLMSRASISTSTTLALSHLSQTLICTNSSAITITVPPNSSVAFAVGSMITVAAAGTGTVTFAEGSGVTINSKNSNLEIDGQYSAATLLKTATDTWILWGALA